MHHCAACLGSIMLIQLYTQGSTCFSFWNYLGSSSPPMLFSHREVQRVLKADSNQRLGRSYFCHGSVLVEFESRLSL